MPEELKNGTKAVGFKETRRAVLTGKAQRVYLAADADPALCETLEELCVRSGIAVDRNATMKELGQACSISVGAAAAALLKG